MTVHYTVLCVKSISCPFLVFHEKSISLFWRRYDLVRKLDSNEMPTPTAVCLLILSSMSNCLRVIPIITPLCTCVMGFPGYGDVMDRNWCYQSKERPWFPIIEFNSCLPSVSNCLKVINNFLPMLNGGEWKSATGGWAKTGNDVAVLFPAPNFIYGVYVEFLCLVVTSKLLFKIVDLAGNSAPGGQKIGFLRNVTLIKNETLEACVMRRENRACPSGAGRRVEERTRKIFSAYTYLLTLSFMPNLVSVSSTVRSYRFDFWPFPWAAWYPHNWAIALPCCTSFHFIRLKQLID